MNFMSMHVHSDDYHCKKCGTVYIPFKPEAVCPKCGEKPHGDVGEYYNFARKVAGVMRTHKRNFGSFFPNGWYARSYDSHVQSDAFGIFDYMENAKPADETEFIKSHIKKNWAGPEFYIDQITEIMLAINAEYKLDPPPIVDELEEKIEEDIPVRLTFWKKFSNFWKSLIS